MVVCSPPNHCGTSQSTPFGAQRPRCHSFLPPIDVGPPQIHPLWGPASLLAHRLVSTSFRGTARRLAYCPVSGSDTICNGPDPPLADGVDCDVPHWLGGEQTTIYNSVETFPYRTHFKALRGSPKGKAQRGQYLLAVDLGRCIRDLKNELRNSKKAKGSKE